MAIETCLNMRRKRENFLISHANCREVCIETLTHFCIEISVISKTLYYNYLVSTIKIILALEGSESGLSLAFSDNSNNE
jgi:hypothetical protein